MTGEQGERRSTGLIGDPNRRWLHDTVARHFVFEGLFVDNNGNDVTTFQFVNIEKWSIGRCPVSTKNEVSILSR
jgi:hypothetical protein